MQYSGLIIVYLISSLIVSAFFHAYDPVFIYDGRGNPFFRSLLFSLCWPILLVGFWLSTIYDRIVSLINKK